MFSYFNSEVSNRILDINKNYVLIQGGIENVKKKSSNHLTFKDIKLKKN